MNHNTVFTYMPNSERFFTEAEGTCDCCGEKAEKYHISYSKWWNGRNKGTNEEDYRLQLCAKCLSSGAAASKFSVKFNYVINPSDEVEAVGRDEVMYRTPAYRSNKEAWPVHCGEACAYVGCYDFFSYDEDIPDDLIEKVLRNVDDQATFVYARENDVDCVTHVFKCRHCDEYFGVLEHKDRTMHE